MSPPPGKTPGHLTFLKTFGQIPWYVGSLDGQKCLALQKASNPPPTMCEIVYSNIIILLNTTQGGALREDTKNGCAADKIQPKYLVLRRFVHFNKIVHSRKPTFNGLFKGSQTLQQNSEYRSICPWTRCACWMRKELWNPFCWNADQCFEHESQMQNFSQMSGYTLGDGWFWNWLAHNWGSEFKRWHSYPENLTTEVNIVHMILPWCHVSLSGGI